MHDMLTGKETAQQVLADKKKTDYVQIATPLVERGFRVTPVHPETKSGVMRNWQNHQATTADEVLKHAKYYPHHNVGVVGKRGVGRHMFLDIDADGVVERVEHETGRKMPRTYTVCSRPHSGNLTQLFPQPTRYFYQITHAFVRCAVRRREAQPQSAEFFVFNQKPKNLNF